MRSGPDRHGYAGDGWNAAPGPFAGDHQDADAECRNREHLDRRGHQQHSSRKTEFAAPEGKRHGVEHAAGAHPADGDDDGLEEAGQHHDQDQIERDPPLGQRDLVHAGDAIVRARDAVFATYPVSGPIDLAIVGIVERIDAVENVDLELPFGESFYT